MDYMRVTLFIKPETIEPLTTLLVSRGIEGLELQDSSMYWDLMKKEHSYEWDYLSEEVLALKNAPVTGILYFEDTETGINQMEDLFDELSSLPIEKVEVTSVSDDAWLTQWKQYFKPTKITDKLIVKPTWEPYQKQDQSELIIDLDPGMAFGTGTHSTTTLCMRLMERYLEPDWKVLDIGTGSGILSIGAALLGASFVLGIDIDPLAVEIAKENVKTNHLDSKIAIREGDLVTEVTEQVDLILANLMADLVIHLTEYLSKALCPGGIFISSGILTEQRTRVETAIRTSGFDILEVLEDGEWCAIAAKDSRKLPLHEKRNGK